MDTKNLEVVQLKKSDKAGEPGKGGKLETAKQDEAGGRALERRYGQCSVCGFVGVFVYDTNAYHYYTCSSCGATIVA